MNLKRRNFLRLTAGSAAAALFSSCSKGAPSETGDTEWQDGMPINPDISNMRVVCCHDAGMISALTNATGLSE